MRVTSEMPPSSVGGEPEGADGPQLSGMSARPDPEAGRRIRHEDLTRTERIMIRVRWVAVAFAAVQVLAYDNLPHDPWVTWTGLSFAAVLAVVNVAAMVLSPRISSYRGTRRLALSTLSADIAVSSGLVWLYAFDQESAMWAILFVVPLEGAVRFRLFGALATWAAVTVLYTFRELWGSATYGYDFEWNSVSFRMGINLLIALVAGFMAADLVRQRSKAEAALAELARVDALRRQLVSTLAHDVRGPLTAIQGSLTVLTERPGLDEAYRNRLLRMAESQTGRLEYLAADLLDLARLEEGRLELAESVVPVPPLVERALQFVDVDGVFDIQVPAGTAVRGDARRIEQVLVNLAANALRHGSPPFEVHGEQRGDDVVLSVCDNGPGVPSQRRDELFQAFQAGHEDTSSVGLGLWIVRLLTEAQGGSVDYSRSGGISRFQVTLPAAQSSP